MRIPLSILGMSGRVSNGYQEGGCPEGMCLSAWSSMREFVESLARGEGNFYDGWMKNPMSAMISCNDGFRPFSFYIEVIGEMGTGVCHLNFIYPPRLA